MKRKAGRKGGSNISPFIQTGEINRKRVVCAALVVIVVDVVVIVIIITHPVVLFCVV